jgi:hypothetical protein
MLIVPLIPKFYLGSSVNLERVVVVVSSLGIMKIRSEISGLALYFDPTQHTRGLVLEVATGPINSDSFLYTAVPIELLVRGQGTLNSK